MPSKKQLEQNLHDKMVSVIMAVTDISQRDAEVRASHAIKEMDNTVWEWKEERKQRQEELNNRLREHMSAALVQAFSKLADPVYRGLLEQLETLVIKRFSGLSTFKDIGYIEENYSRLEQNFMVTFLNVLPNATATSTTLARDLMADHLIHTFDIASLKLSLEEVQYVRNFFETVFTIFCGLSKIELQEAAQETYLEREKFLLESVRSTFQRTKNTETVEALRKQCDNILQYAELRLTEYQRMNVCDQILWLFTDYINAPPEERDQIYATGEERIIISVFDPAVFGRPASSRTVD